jgi:glucose-6-phosphate isomerase
VQFAPLERNLPVLMGLLGVWNMSFMGYRTRTILPYAEALLKLPAHIQQLAMESNGKRVTVDGEELDYDIGQIDFGEPGTNGQHSFFQLLHMGQVRWANTAYHILLHCVQSIVEADAVCVVSSAVPSFCFTSCSY